MFTVKQFPENQRQVVIMHDLNWKFKLHLNREHKLPYNLNIFYYFSRYLKEFLKRFSYSIIKKSLLRIFCVKMF